jgi:predicted ATPase
MALGQYQTGLEVIADALAHGEQGGSRWCEAELYRLQGELLQMQGAPADQVEACLERAIAVARRQQAKSWELRATVSLCRLWQRQGKTTEAHGRLAAIYGWFTEGFDSPDLQDAKTLLASLA